MTDSSLPIYEIQSRIVDALRAGNRLVLTAPTGSGKTTQVPRMLHRAGVGAGEIVVLQPRRLAARMVAERVAHEMGGRIGEVVGYQTRHDSKVSRETRIRFVTEGLFLRQMQGNPKLEGVGVVILDEFHERNLATDTAVALVKQLQERQRPDLKLVVMSATLDAEKVASYLGCEALAAHGRMYPVAVRYLEKRAQAQPWELAADAVADVLDRKEPGDVLVFMPGGYEIRRTIELVERHDHPHDPISVFPLYSELSPREQDAALGPAAQRKVIVSTNVAETSITIPGIRHVIDSGLARVNRFDPRRGINVLMVEGISRASAEQRAGRAGRTAPGTCTRLWTETEHRQRAGHETPEIQRLDLAEVLLQLKSYGVEDVRMFPWLEAPGELAVQQALGVLELLGAIDREGRLTEMGRGMARLPMHPRLSRMMVEAGERGCVRGAATWAALISERDILARGAGERFRQELPEGAKSDFLVLEQAMDAAEGVRFDAGRCAGMGVVAGAAREVDRTRRLYEEVAARNGGNGGSQKPLAPALSPSAGRGGKKAEETLAERGDGKRSRPVFGQVGLLAELVKCLLAGFPDHLAMRRSEKNLACALVGNRRGALDPESVAKHVGLILPVEVREIGSAKDVKTVLSLATEVELDWLYEVHPDRVEQRTETYFNAETMAVETADREYFDGLLIHEKVLHEADRSAAGEILAEEVARGTLKLEAWDEAVEQWIERVRCVAQWFPEKGLIAYDEDDRRIILEEICAGHVRYKEIREKPVLEFVKNALSWEDQRFVEKMAPERIELPRGWRMKVEYTPGQAPKGRAKIQDFYGMEETPTVAGGRVRLLLEILGPNFRPVQLTEDLAGFWKNLYPVLKKELSRKYPRHEWK